MRSGDKRALLLLCAAAGAACAILRSQAKQQWWDEEAFGPLVPHKTFTGNRPTTAMPFFISTPWTSNRPGSSKLAARRGLSCWRR